MREPLTVTQRIMNPKLEGSHVMVRGVRSYQAKMFVYSGRIRSVGLDYIHIVDFETGDAHALRMADFDGQGKEYDWVELFELGPTEQITDKERGKENE